MKKKNYKYLYKCGIHGKFRFKNYMEEMAYEADSDICNDFERHLDMAKSTLHEAEVIMK